MVSLPEELWAREAAARRCAEKLQAEAAELALRLEKVREDLSQLEIARETVTQVVADLLAAQAEPQVVAVDVPDGNERSAPHGVGVMMVPPWRDGLVVAVLPDVYRDIVEIIADAPGPVQAKQIAADRSADDHREDRGDPGHAEAPGGARLAGRGHTETVHPRPPGPGARPHQLLVTKGPSSVDT